MVGQVIKYLLSTNSVTDDNPAFEILEIVGQTDGNTKYIFPNVLPQNYGTPALVYTITGNEPSRIKELKSIATTAEFEIDVIAESYSVVNQLVNLIIPHLDRYKNTYNSADDTDIGFGSPAATLGSSAPPSTGPIQYVAGFQIVDLYFINSTEYFDDKLELFRNTLNFKMTYINDSSLLQPDLFLKLNDLNLMATNVGGSDDPLYTQPVSLNQGVNIIWGPSLYLTGNSNIVGDTIDGNYNYFKDPSDTSNTNRPTIKKSALNPPKYNELNYLEFATDEFLEGISFLEQRYLKEFTFFSVFSLPQSTSTTKGAAILYKKSTDTNNIASVFVSCENTGGSLGATYYKVKGTVRDSDTTYTGFQVFSALKWAALGINVNLDFSDPVFIAFSLEKESSTKISGQVKLIMSADFATYGDTLTFGAWYNTGTFETDNIFNYMTLHSDVSSFDPDLGNTTALNDEIHIYDLAIYPEKITFGNTKFDQIKRNIIEKHDMLNRTT